MDEMELERAEAPLADVPARRLLREVVRPMPPTIATAIAIAQSRMKRVAHDGKNAHHGYRYTSAEAIIEAAIEPMAAAGLGLVQCGWEDLPPERQTWFDVNDKGEQMRHDVSGPARLMIRYILVHQQSGESWELPAVTMPVLPEKGRPVDKAEATALTYSLGYVLRGLLKIPRTDDGDDLDQRDDRSAQQRPPAGQQRPPQRAQQRKEPAKVEEPPPDVDELLGDIRGARTEQELRAAWGKAYLLKKTLPAAVFGELERAKERSKARLAGEDPGDQPEPDGSHEEELGYTSGDA